MAEPEDGTDTGGGATGLGRLRRVLYGRTALMIRLALAVPILVLFARHALERAQQAAPPRSLGHAPAFELDNQLGETVTDADLRGHPWVANFIFTRCPSVCPLLTAKFQNFQRRVDDLEGVRFVSFSVDPEHDTPEVLAEYAAKYEADPAHWWFLTGSMDALQQAVVKGFKIYIGEREPSESDPTIFDIAHGEHFVLVDSQGRIVAYHDASSEGLRELERDLRALVH